MCQPILTISLDNFNLPDKTIDKIYDDAFQPAAHETGKLLGRIPRAINAVFFELDKWILQKEYNVEQTKQVLENKLSSVDPEKIVSPEPYVAIPALESIPYTISNEELYNLYANLLAKAMYADTKESVHPSFVEIIKQLSPADALVLKEFATSKKPIAAAMFSILLRVKGLHILGQSPEEHSFLELAFDIQLPNLSEQQIRISIDNLKRLGLISLLDFSLSGESAYAFAKSTELYSKVKDEFAKLNQSETLAETITTKEKALSLTPIGELFCKICILDFE